MEFDLLFVEPPESVWNFRGDSLDQSLRVNVVRVEWETNTPRIFAIRKLPLVRICESRPNDLLHC